MFRFILYIRLLHVSFTYLFDYGRSNNPKLQKQGFSVYMIVRSLISAHFCVISFLHPVKTFNIVFLLPTFPFCPSLAGSTSSQGTLCHKKGMVSDPIKHSLCLDCQRQGSRTELSYYPWLRKVCHTPVYWKTRYSVKLVGYFGNDMFYSPKNKNLLKLKHRRGTVLTLFGPISYTKIENPVYRFEIIFSFII